MQGHARSQKIPTFTIVTKALKVARYDGAGQILSCPLFFEKMAVRKDAHKFMPCKDACLDATT